MKKRKRPDAPKRKAGRPPLHLVDWDSVGLGEQPDVIIAERLGVATSTVKYHRDHRKIPAFSARKLFS